ncbi:class E sortase [Kitasatospora sp. NPDC091207]|uniref:class E sortase n=1 Tax=Kitasatospora sp. NPDC091207 TaxID=3364083 RepID=UPI003808967F
MPAPPVLAAALALSALAVLAGCAGAAGPTAGPGPVSAPPGSVAASVPPGTTTSAAAAGSAATAPSAPAATGSPGTAAPASPSAPAATLGRTETASLAIPSIGLAGLRVVPYQGTTDDGPGTRIQNGGVAASPYGEQGGVGPGEVGNYLVTAHRLSAGGPLRKLPAVREGDAVLVTVGGVEYEYVITGTRSTSFRSAQSLAEQRAAVPGRPGERAVQAMITLSTCATPEDDATGERWRDAQGNPEHRIDKIGVLRASRPAA